MRILTSTILLTIVALSASVSRAAGPVVEPMSYESLETYESRIFELENRLADIESNDGANSCEAGDCWCQPCSGISFMAEVLWLRAYDSEDGDLSASSEDGSRYTLGYVGEHGWGGRIRYFELGIRDLSPSAFPGGLINFETFDAELTGRFRAGCGWWGTVSGGVRYADFIEENTVHYQDSYGPVVGLEMSRVFRCNVRLYGIVRQSYQFGQDVENNTGETMFGISELQLGAEWNRTTSGGCNFFIRSFVEAQQWDSLEDNDSEDIGLIGGGLAVGIAL